MTNEAKIRSSAKYNSDTTTKHLAHEIVHSTYNHRYIIDAIRSGRAMDVSQVPKAPKDPEPMPFINIGSGPSLDESIPYLKDWKGGIFCSTSHALTLMKYGIEPTHIVALDPFCRWEEIEGVDWSKTKTILVLTPSVHPSLVENWPNTMALFIQNGGKPNSFYQSTQKLMYSEHIGEHITDITFKYLITTEVPIFACSPPLQLLIAKLLGYGTCFNAGCDFGFNNGKDRFTNYIVKNPGRTIQIGNGPDIYVDTEWEAIEHPFVQNEHTIFSNKGIPTEEIHVYYKKNYLCAWRLSLGTMYRTDKESIMTEVPFISMKNVVKKQGYHFPQQDKRWISRTVEEYLVLSKSFVVEIGTENVLFVECLDPDWEKEMGTLLNKIKLEYVCPTCHAIVASNDDVDRVNTECPQCKKGVLKYRSKMDVDYNMNKFRKLFKECYKE